MPLNGIITFPDNRVDPILPWRTAVIFFGSSGRVDCFMPFQFRLLLRFEKLLINGVFDFGFFEPYCLVNQVLSVASACSSGVAQ